MVTMLERVQAMLGGETDCTHADLLRGLAWGRGRLGLPEGRLGLYVASILARIGGCPWMRG